MNMGDGKIVNFPYLEVSFQKIYGAKLEQLCFTNNIFSLFITVIARSCIPNVDKVICNFYQQRIITNYKQFFLIQSFYQSYFLSNK